MAKQITNTLESNETKIYRALHKQVDTGSIPEELIPKITDSPETYRKRLIEFLLTHHHINVASFFYNKEAENNGLYERLEELNRGSPIPYEHKNDATILRAAQESSYVLLQGYENGYECRYIETQIVRCFILDAKTFKAVRNLPTAKRLECWNEIQDLMADLDKEEIIVDDESIKFAPASDSPNSVMDTGIQGKLKSPGRKKRGGGVSRREATRTSNSPTAGSSFLSPGPSTSRSSNSKTMQARDIFADVSMFRYEKFEGFMDSTTMRDEDTLKKIKGVIKSFTSAQTMPFLSDYDDKDNNAFKTGRELSNQRSLTKAAAAFQMYSFDHKELHMSPKCKEYLEDQDELTQWTINEYQYQLSLLNQILSILIKKGGFHIINCSTTHEKYRLEFDFGIPVNAVTLMTYLDTRLGIMSIDDQRVNIVEKIMKLRIQITEDLSSDVMYEAAHAMLTLVQELHLCTDGQGNLSNREVTTLIGSMTSTILSQHSTQLRELKTQLQEITTDKYLALRDSDPNSGKIKYGMISMIISLFGTIADDRKAEENKYKVHNGPAVASGNSTTTHIALLNISSDSPGSTLINSSVTVPLQEQVPFCLWQFCATCAKENKEFHFKLCKFQKCKHDHDEVKIQTAMKSNDPRFTCNNCGIMGCPSIIGDKMQCQKEFNKDSKHKGGKHGKRKNNRNNNPDRNGKKQRENDHNLRVTLNQALDVINNFHKNGSATSQNGANSSQASSSSTPTVAAATTTGSNLSSSSSSTPTVASGATTDAEKKSDLTKRLQTALLERANEHANATHKKKKQKPRNVHFRGRGK